MPDLDPIAEAREQWLRHGWHDAADGMAAITALTRVQQLLTERIEAVLRPHQLSFARYEVLRLLSFTRSGSMRMARLGSLLQVHPTSVTSAVDRLERQGYVERVRTDTDRRVVRACITATGTAVVERATAALNEQVFTSPGWSPEELRSLTELLRRFRVAVGDLEP